MTLKSWFRLIVFGIPLALFIGAGVKQLYTVSFHPKLAYADAELKWAQGNWAVSYTEHKSGKYYYVAQDDLVLEACSDSRGHGLCKKKLASWPGRNLYIGYLADELRVIEVVDLQTEEVLLSQEASIKKENRGSKSGSWAMIIMGSMLLWACFIEIYFAERARKAKLTAA